MNIDLNNPAMAMIALNRLRQEYSETAFANFVLDEVCTRLTVENEALRKQNSELIEKTTADKEIIRELTQQITKSDRKRKVKGDGTNSGDSI
jgi:regulator of replication initiation timing